MGLDTAPCRIPRRGFLFQDPFAIQQPPRRDNERRLLMRKRGCFCKLALVVIGALVLVMLAAPSVFATTCQTRVQALGEELCSYVSTQVANDVAVPLSNGGVFQSTVPNPLAALYLTGVLRGFPLEVSSSDFGVFVNKVGGYGDPVGWSNWWLYAVNGFMSPLGASTCEAQDGDQYLWINVPSAAPWNNMALVVNGPTTVPLGGSATFTVVGDDLGKVNSQADLARFGLDPATTPVQTPAEFESMAGATVHAGSGTQIADNAGSVTVSGTAPGTYLIWAEKDYDSSFFYVPSTRATTFTVPFSDVASSSPYYAAIHKIAGLDIAGGYRVSDAEIDFRPTNTLYRAQFAKMIAIALGLEVQEGSSSPFADLGEQVIDNLYPHDYVAAAYKAGITSGITASTFAPYKDISRAQVVTLVVRALQKLHPGVLATPASGYRSTWGTFSAVHEENARIAQFNGLLDGLPLTSAAADPWGPMSRGETAQVLANLVQILGK
jgi:hypothetical protein